jgi:hypothetical protein
VPIAGFADTAADANLAVRAIAALGRYPHAEAAPVLRAILGVAEADPRGLHAAVFALSRLHRSTAVPGAGLGADMDALQRVLAGGRLQGVARDEARRLLEVLQRQG